MFYVKNTAVIPAQAGIQEEKMDPRQAHSGMTYCGPFGDD